MKGNPRDYQIADLAFYLQTPRCLNTSDPGTGKTCSVCMYAWLTWDEDRKRTVWSMPKSLLKKNREELLIFSGFKPEDVVIVDHNNPKKRIEAINSNAKVFLIGFTAFATNWEYLLKRHPDIGLHLVDELHMGFGGHTSKRTQALYGFMEKVEKFVGMSGTIINGRLSSIYPCCQVIKPGFYYDYQSFMFEHAVEDDYGRVVAWTNPKKLSVFLRNFAIRHTFEEVYGPEAKVIIPEFVPMDPKQREAYDEFEEAALLELEDTWLDGSASKAVHLIRCRQIMEHPQTLGAPLDEIKMTGKEERLLVHLEDCKQSGKPIIVFAAMQAQIERITEMAKKIGLRVGMIHGGVSNNRRFEVDEQFRAGQLDVVVASPATTAVGYNWGFVDTVVFVSLDYMDSSFVQGYRRAIRGVRGRPLLIYILLYEDCDVEDRVVEIVERKAALSNAVDETKEAIKLKPRAAPKAPAKPLPIRMSDTL